MELEITSDQEFFLETTRRSLDERVTTAAQRDMRDDPVGFGADYWKQGAELGWTSELVSEADGGGAVASAWRDRRRHHRDGEGPERALTAV
jgi:alkylation response protein AidB-like acyl-CoA dehydrogenase